MKWAVMRKGQAEPVQTFDHKIDAQRFYREHESSNPADPGFDLYVKAWDEDTEALARLQESSMRQFWEETKGENL